MSRSDALGFARRPYVPSEAQTLAARSRQRRFRFADFRARNGSDQALTNFWQTLGESACDLVCANALLLLTRDVRRHALRKVGRHALDKLRVLLNEFTKPHAGRRAEFSAQRFVNSTRVQRLASSFAPSRTVTLVRWLAKPDCDTSTTAVTLSAYTTTACGTADVGGTWATPSVSAVGGTALTAPSM